MQLAGGGIAPVVMRRAAPPLVAVLLLRFLFRQFRGIEAESQQRAVEAHEVYATITTCLRRMQFYRLLHV